MEPSASILIPAHNEARVLRRCLETLLRTAEHGEFEVCVVSNGSTDGTAELAAELLKDVENADVVELDEASKLAALRDGDARLTVFPRVYLDADILLTTQHLRSLVGLLASTDSAVVASPGIRVDDSRSSWFIRAYNRVWVELPYVKDGVIGSGVYAVNQAGGERKGQFPEVLADDEYVRSVFAVDERLNSDGYFTMVAPRNALSLIRRRARVDVGNTDLNALIEGSGKSTSGRSVMAGLAERQFGVLDLAVYLALTGAAMMLARYRRVRGASQMWSTDVTSR